MKLVKFSVTNFRSITAAHKISISETTILIGKNNEGKSNVLKALQLAMQTLQQHARGRISFSQRYPFRERYNWTRDFPISIQDRKGVAQTIFILEFLLSTDEIAEFKEVIGSNLNGSLPLAIRYGKDNLPKIKVNKQGKGSTTLNRKSTRIADFVEKRIYFNYIPAIRTDKEALGVIGEMLSQELGVLEKNEAYKAALDTISQLQRPILDDLAARIRAPLAEFLPNISDVRIEILEQKRRNALRKNFKVIIDDGTPTDIEFKGDGVKSLAALGLLKDRNMAGRASIIAIEEPESHLHPGAMHQLNEIIGALADNNQLIITTHNPLFVDRNAIRSNIIIDNGRALPAKNIGVIRDLLGIRASDNLVNANYVLVVEGEEDVISLKALLPVLSKKLGKVLKENYLVIEPIGGAGNLPYKLSMLRNALCMVHVLLDNDEAGRCAFENASDENLVRLKNCTMTTCQGMNDSEFEDCLDVLVYQREIHDKFGVDLNTRYFRTNKKWSDRIRESFVAQGKPWNDSIKKKVKYIVGKCVAAHPRTALNQHKRSSMDALVTSLENIVSGLG